MFSAFLGEERIIPYQPKRKSKYDPKPEVEYHTLQETMARVADNVKSRQDSEVRKFMKELEEQIESLMKTAFYLLTVARFLKRVP